MKYKMETLQRLKESNELLIFLLKHENSEPKKELMINQIAINNIHLKSLVVDFVGNSPATC